MRRIELYTAVLFLIVLSSQTGCGSSTTASAELNTEHESISAPIEPEPDQGWRYHQSENYARHSRIRFAEIASERSADGTFAELTIREERPRVTQFFLTKEVNNFACEGGGRISVSFDGRYYASYPCLASRTGNAPSIFGYENRAIILRMKSASVMTVTADPPAGGYSATFNIRGFTW